MLTDKLHSQTSLLNTDKKITPPKNYPPPQKKKLLWNWSPPPPQKKNSPSPRHLFKTYIMVYYFWLMGTVYCYDFQRKTSSHGYHR